MGSPRTVAFHTLGCKLNFSETSSLQRMFEDQGYHVAEAYDHADVFVLNTCSVTDFADRKCRKFVRRVLRQNPQARVVVTGCYAQLKPTEIADIEGVDMVLGAAEKFRMLDYIDQLDGAKSKGTVHTTEISEVSTFNNAFSFGDRTRSFLKVQDGCDYNCSFCTIPQARGRSRSDTLDQVVANAQQIGESGVREIVLTGVNLGDFGNGTEVIEGERPKKNDLFIDLIRALDRVDSVERFRISSIEPNLCTGEIIEFVAGSSRFMPHFHMPLQSGNNKQLAMMRRRYRRELYEDRVKLIKKVMPHACIGVDVIVGFPGETDEDFLETQRFIESLDVSYLHVFTYSERPNTPAATMSGEIDMNKRRKRNEILRHLSDQKKRSFYEQHLHEDRTVLLEPGKQPGQLAGWTDNYIRLNVAGGEEDVNTMRRVRILPEHLDYN
ncbi:tRNA (N(6)-L-threonylcarbamoyladenosine(37)-C(2))-methylthiotransferase MtaB [Membranicola marinus]|uniref:tRNA (N(6)-L-threonylcarbamoyladenosine(37)-C(2))-methylthiotransferase MtaB n=1 Tax=Membranihabitans marinus TaxID=1227546 RepID=A0A953HUL0_9BACT|nr:tRNA (N(6)-L-threonylcarbamoyladenosine(37)-C(2))-methylthiotransferase MtaB [Membranihabitans marinus]MBY5958158.1 tRNA (N(6)-L-threonylcarbamoyladenosine(37)-C(2))-methylthiotransferase MtaB [Membranihabitans marinus]